MKNYLDTCINILGMDHMSIILYKNPRKKEYLNSWGKATIFVFNKTLRQSILAMSSLSIVLYRQEPDAGLSYPNKYHLRVS